MGGTALCPGGAAWLGSWGRWLWSGTPVTPGVGVKPPGVCWLLCLGAVALSSLAAAYTAAPAVAAAVRLRTPTVAVVRTRRVASLL